MNNETQIRTWSNRWRPAMTGWFFLLPVLLFIGGFILLPVMATIFTSFLRDVSFLEPRFVLFENYQRLASDRRFYQSLFFTLSFTAAAVPLELLLGLGFALLLDLRLPIRGFLRAAILIPWAIPAAISARIWELIYNYNYGLANYLLQTLGLSSGPVNWLGSNWSAFAGVVLADVWKTTPFVAIIVLAGLQAIPDELLAQAKIDRCNFWQSFRYITLPLLKPVLIVALLFRTIDSLRVFDIMYVLTGGGPGGSTTSVSQYAYQYYSSSDFGYGSTVSVLLFAVALLLSILYVKISRFQAEAK